MKSVRILVNSKSHYFPRIFLSRAYSSRTNTIINFVPQQEAWVVERFGRFYKVLTPGLNFLYPLVDSVKYVQNLKEIAVHVPSQSAITEDNVALTIDAILFYKVIDPYQASYAVEDHEYAITQLALTAMRAEIGKIILDDLFSERDSLNSRIVESIRNSIKDWGIQCMRYEIRDITLPKKVLEAMQMQVEAERKKRASILESEGVRESAVNIANGEAQAIILKNEANAKSLNIIAEALNSKSGGDAASMVIAEQYVNAFSKLAQSTNTLILPSNIGDMGSAISQGFAIFKSLMKKDQNPENNRMFPPNIEKSMDEDNITHVKVREIPEVKNKK